MERYFLIRLIYYTEENVLESGASVIALSDQDLTQIPFWQLKEKPFIQEAMEQNDCESIGYISEINADLVSPDEEVINLCSNTYTFSK